MFSNCLKIFMMSDVCFALWFTFPLCEKLHRYIFLQAIHGGLSRWLFPSGCSFAVEILGYMAASWNLPLITPVGTKSSLSNKRDYNTVTRLSYDMSKFAKFYRTLFNYFQWEHVAVIYDLDNIFSKIVGDSLHKDFEINRLYSKEFAYSSTENPDYDAIFNKASALSRSKCSNLWSLLSFGVLHIYALVISKWFVSRNFLNITKMFSRSELCRACVSKTVTAKVVLGV